MTAVKFHVYSTKVFEDRDDEVLENNGQKREAATEFTNKRAKYELLAEYRNAATDSKSRKKTSHLTAEVNELRALSQQLHHWCQFETAPCCS